MFFFFNENTQAGFHYLHTYDELQLYSFDILGFNIPDRKFDP